MKTLADLKRDLIVGKSIEMTYNAFKPRTPELSLIGKIRKIRAVNSVGISIEREKDGIMGKSELRYPKANELEYIGDTFSIYNDKKELELSYKIHN